MCVSSSENPDSSENADSWTLDNMIDFIRASFPEISDPTAFGLHSNANITKDQNETHTVSLKFFFFYFFF